MNEEKLLEVINRMRKRREDAQNKIERLQKEKDRYYKALIEIAGFEGVDFDGSQIAIEALKER